MIQSVTTLLQKIAKNRFFTKKIFKYEYYEKYWKN